MLRNYYEGGGKMSEYIVATEQIEELNRAHGGMKIVTSWLSSYAIWDTSNTYPAMKSEHVSVDLPEIVRCRDCRYCMSYWKCDYCDYFSKAISDPDGFCAWGEKTSEQRL